jgi:membrane protein DedA with SNARE-associated domain
VKKLFPLLMHKLNAWMLVLFAFLAPFGVWGLGALALIDSALFPIPVSMDGVLIGYVATNHGLFLLYCLMAAAASALGALVPYYVGRAGGELFLLKRIMSFLKLYGVNFLTLFGVCSGVCGSLLNCQRRPESWLWRGSVCSFRI